MTHALPPQESTALRQRAILRVLAITLVLNLIVAILKLVFGHASGSVALWADGLHSLLDSSSNVVAIVGIWVAHRPPDPGHPYGHRKFEAMAALAISAFLFFACYEILMTALDRFKGSHTIEQSPAIYAVAIGTLFVNLFVSRYERVQGKRLGSEVLLADSVHTGSDVWATLLVLLSFVSARFGWTVVDGASALVIAAVIAYAGWQIVQRTLPTLADAALIPAENLVEEAERVAGVRECHEVRSRGVPDEVLVDLHILVDPMLPIAEAHQIGHRVERVVRTRWPEVQEVLVHIEPDEPGERKRKSRV
ncbi:MAG: cation diffusion facilitator family transporter [Candidatus Eiseniibacteriota bacterium]